MTTDGRTVRRGLPRIPGGEPWPPGGQALVVTEAEAVATAPNAAPSVGVPSHVVGGVIRRGLPRVPSGEPWPPSGAGAPAADAPVAVSAVAVASEPKTSPARAATAAAESLAAVIAPTVDHEGAATGTAPA